MGKNSFLRNALEGNDVTNMILWGPPGCGKTSLANIIGVIVNKNINKYTFLEMSAAHCSSTDVQNIMLKVKDSVNCEKVLVLFIDEIHRLNKSQRNKLLAQIVTGSLVLIGATTENPSFIFSQLFLSHCPVIVMQKLSIADIVLIIKNALTTLNITIIDDKNTLLNLFERNNVRIQNCAIAWLAENTDGDARIALNNLQMVLQFNNGKKLLTIADMKEAMKSGHLLYDRNGEEHHNIISAMHESIKAYKDSAALYWTTRMLKGGEDRLFIGRRLIRAASENIGNADPRALQLAVNTMQGCQLLGTPECDILLAQCAIYLARAPTSKTIESALALAKQTISNCKEKQPPVPIYLSRASRGLVKELGYDILPKSFMPAGFENVKFL